MQMEFGVKCVSPVSWMSFIEVLEIEGFNDSFFDHKKLGSGLGPGFRRSPNTDPNL
jgi:hypothetical protein